MFRTWSTGVLGYQEKTSNLQTLLQHSNTPELSNIQRSIRTNFFWIIDPFFCLRREIGQFSFLIICRITMVCTADRSTKYPTHSGIPHTIGSIFPQAQKSMDKMKCTCKKWAKKSTGKKTMGVKIDRQNKNPRAKKGKGKKTTGKKYQLTKKSTVAKNPHEKN